MGAGPGPEGPWRISKECDAGSDPVNSKDHETYETARGGGSQAVDSKIVFVVNGPVSRN